MVKRRKVNKSRVIKKLKTQLIFLTIMAIILILGGIYNYIDYIQEEIPQMKHSGSLIVGIISIIIGMGLLILTYDIHKKLKRKR